MQRYKSLIPDWDKFIASLDRPMPRTLRVNRLKVDPKTLRENLEDKGFKVEPAEWCPYFFRVEGAKSLGLLFDHWLGRYYVQEESSMIAPMALDPQPGERVLDMCAAPGGKTTHMAELMQNSGTILANDGDWKRIKALGGNLCRMGILNTLTTVSNALELPEETMFDRVLLDAPCSAEGNARRSRFVRNGASTRYINKISALQRDLLLKAIDMTKIGGTIVYSTCTFAPEENERIVQSALDNRHVRIEPIELDAPHLPGISEWDGQRFDESMELCWRIYPHTMDSGGAFIAKLTKLDDERQIVDHITRHVDKSDNYEDLIDYYRVRFDVDPAEFAGKGYVRNVKYIWMTTADLRMIPIFQPTAFGLRIAGLKNDQVYRPTDWGLVYLGKRIRRNRVDLPADSLRSILLSGGKRIESGAEDGYVALCFRGEVIGSGLLSNGNVKSQLQSSHKKHLYESLRIEGVI